MAGRKKRGFQGRYFKPKTTARNQPEWEKKMNEMVRTAALAAGVATLALAHAPAQGQEKLKIGIIATLSGPPAVLGQYAQDKGLKQLFLMAPNYQAGKDALAGVKRYFKGEVLDEVYVPLGQLDYQAELTRIAAAKPDAIFVFLPGGMGVNFVKQFRQAGLADKITFLSAFTVDEATLPAQQDAAIGFFGGANWAPNLDNPQNKAFVAAYEKEYGAVPATYAFQAYDAALLIDSAVRTVKGNLTDRDALRASLQKADFQS